MSENGEVFPPRPFLRIGLETLVVTIGVLLLAGAIIAEQSWWDRHFLPVFFFSRDKYVLGERLARLACGITGIALILFAVCMLGRLARRMTARELSASTSRIVLAIGLALAASEVLLDRQFTFA